MGSNNPNRITGGSNEYWVLLSSWLNPGLVLQSTWWHETFSWTLTAQFLSASLLDKRHFYTSQTHTVGLLFNKQQTQTKSSFRLLCNLWYSLLYSLNQSNPVDTAAGLTARLHLTSIYLEQHLTATYCQQSKVIR